LIDIAEMAFWRPNFSLRLIGVVESKKALERRIKHMLNRPVPKSSKLGFLGLFAIVVIGSILLPMGCNPAKQTALETPVQTTLEAPVKEESKESHIPSTSIINEQGHIVDKIDYPFVNDPEVIGGWKSVDFVEDIDAFDPTKKSWQGNLFLNHLIFEEGGKIAGNLLTWTKGLVFYNNDFVTASKYQIKEIDGSEYIFYEWKSGDYSVRHSKPSYYVLKREPVESLKYEPMLGKKADIPATSTINEQGRLVDKLDYPFVNDPQVVGKWKSVDFVSEIEQFQVGEQQWKGRGGELFFKELIILPKGKTFKPWWTWTKGLIFHSGDKTASKYALKDMDGSTYMFYEWKSGDYAFRYRKPSYYVLKKISSETGGLAEVGASRPNDAEFARQKAELAKQKAELDKARAEIEKDKAEIEKAMAEIERAQAEIEKAKTEAEKAKAETERVKSEANRQASEVERLKK